MKIVEQNTNTDECSPSHSCCHEKLNANDGMDGSSGAESPTGRAHNSNDDSIHENENVHGDEKETRMEHSHICEDAYRRENIAMPPPLPEPKYSFHRRVMPESLIQFSSPEGRKLFKESLAHGTSEAFFPLAEQFLNQSEPAYCGVTSLVMVLNATGIDPKVRWKSGWRWYSDEMILDTCCLNAERVKRAGILMEEFQSLARCQGLGIEMKRPLKDGYGEIVNNDGKGATNIFQKMKIISNSFIDKKEEKDQDQDQDDDNEEDCYGSLDDFRNDLIQIVQNPPMYKLYDSAEPSSYRGGFMVVSFSRPSLGQTGSGHYSPIAAYHEVSDRCLVMEVARYKYAPYWVRVKDLYDALKPIDPMTDKSRGWFMLYAPSDRDGFKGTKADDEKKKFAKEDMARLCDDCNGCTSL
mmetsp:Transcript_6695/g.7698  ORF Transcript_6695/g.7698 Transcript_6695/m.7698 type:complete len:410 (+) Transcript_6695:172-1401(+)|eukprot:CAMPEP_0204620266 /NCGR_PEP_ID=MMETSP0717-20131115/6351_1 /ASSEMBLY_ACC=CAM_ASM_000666 /TAXON_ID=230516 /ORGANISM="Chaetoceros curvisetus" /LENGTH=409 /DNA_ID=CAMNT_0051634425 /DNA_START=85 /DNA_END=1314 /DNA_ORIENTATION=-